MTRPEGQASKTRSSRQSATARQDTGGSSDIQQATHSGVGTPPSTTTEADDVTQILERLQIAEEQETSNGREDVEETKADPELHTMVENVKAKLRSGKSPKMALEPILGAFDLEGIAQYIKKGKVKNIIVMSGAGISVSAGIPDFRTPGSGLYDNLQKFNLPHPQAVFELDFFRQDPKPFYLLAKELFPGRFKPTPAHHFLKLLDQKGLLLRVFTQNIDSLEREADVPAERIVAAHGNFDQAHCIECRTEVSQDLVRAAVDAGEVCRCSSCGGLVKPDIVFFGESLPEQFFWRAESDFPKADLLIVMGTSLVVHPFASLIDHVGDKVPRVLINRERVGEADAALSLFGQSRGFRFDRKHRDALFIGDCDEGVKQLADSLGWSDELHSLINADGH